MLPFTSVTNPGMNNAISNVNEANKKNQSLLLEIIFLQEKTPNQFYIIFIIYVLIFQLYKEKKIRLFGMVLIVFIMLHQE